MDRSHSKIVDLVLRGVRITLVDKETREPLSEFNVFGRFLANAYRSIKEKGYGVPQSLPVDYHPWFPDHIGKWERMDLNLTNVYVLPKKTIQFLYGHPLHTSVIVVKRDYQVADRGWVVSMEGKTRTFSKWVKTAEDASRVVQHVIEQERIRMYLCQSPKGV